MTRYHNPAACEPACGAVKGAGQFTQPYHHAEWCDAINNPDPDNADAVEGYRAAARNAVLDVYNPWNEDMPYDPESAADAASNTWEPAVRALVRMVEGLEGQQAMPDHSHDDELAAIKARLNAPTD